MKKNEKEKKEEKKKIINIKFYVHIFLQLNIQNKIKN